MNNEQLQTTARNEAGLLQMDLDVSEKYTENIRVYIVACNALEVYIMWLHF